MKIDLSTADNLFMDYGEELTEILRRAARQALLEHKRAGNPVASWDGEKVVMIAPEDILVEETPELEPH